MLASDIALACVSSHAERPIGLNAQAELLGTVLRVVENDLADPAKALEFYAQLDAPKKPGEELPIRERGLLDRSVFRRFATHPESNIYTKESFNDIYLESLRERVSSES